MLVDVLAALEDAAKNGEHEIVITRDHAIALCLAVRAEYARAEQHAAEIARLRDIVASAGKLTMDDSAHEPTLNLRFTIAYTALMRSRYPEEVFARALHDALDHFRDKMREQESPTRKAAQAFAEAFADAECVAEGAKRHAFAAQCADRITRKMFNPPAPFDRGGALRLALAAADLIRRGRIGTRSPLADALLDFAPEVCTMTTPFSSLTTTTTD